MKERLMYVHLSNVILLRIVCCVENLMELILSAFLTFFEYLKISHEYFKSNKFSISNPSISTKI